MKTIVLDDDPTGTQSVTGAIVLLRSDVESLVAALSAQDSVYVQTNSRALAEAESVALIERIRADGRAAASRLGEEVRFVLRGDSTLRGHVFAETEVLMDDESVMLFVPAFPDGGRTTLDGVHRVQIGDEVLPAHETEYAKDPVFPFINGDLAAYVAEKSSRPAVLVDLAAVRDGGLASALLAAPAGAVVVPDALTDDDIRLIAAAVDEAAAARRIVVRSASPLAAHLAGVASTGLLPVPVSREEGRVLLVCGSHTAGATAQLSAVAAEYGEPVVVDTSSALADPAAAGRRAAAAVRERVASGAPLAFVTTERERSAAHNTLQHGERVMSALTTAVREILDDVSVVVAKGGITSADVARVGIGAERARVLGQILPGVSLWSVRAHDGRELLYAVVPGNVGGPSTLVDVLSAVGLEAAA